MGGPPAWGLGVGLTTPHRKKLSCYENSTCSYFVFYETKSIIKTQHRYRSQYRKDPPSDNAIRRWLKQFREADDVLRRKGAEIPSTSQEDVAQSRKLGLPRKARTLKFLRLLQY
jgi:arsenate reductase-like glutaredoxin family protein